jgi:hypothetical protein
MTGPFTVYIEKRRIPEHWINLGHVVGRLGIEARYIQQVGFDIVEFDSEADAAAFRLAAGFETFDKEEAGQRRTAALGPKMEIYTSTFITPAPHCLLNPPSTKWKPEDHDALKGSGAGR